MFGAIMVGAIIMFVPWQCGDVARQAARGKREIDVSNLMAIRPATGAGNKTRN